MSPGELRSIGTHTVGHPVSEGLVHPHGADVKAYPASAEETAIPSPYREESVSYKVVVEGVSAMATNAFDDEPEIVKEALPSLIENESHAEVSSIPTSDESEMDKESPLSLTETEFLAEVCGLNSKLIKVDDSCEKESLTEGNYLFKGEEENAKTILRDDQDSLPMVADRVKTTVEEEQSPLVVPPAQEDFVIGEPVRAISEVVLDGDLKDSEMQIAQVEGYPGGEGIVIKANPDQEDNPKENPSMLMGIAEDDKSPESTPAERFISAHGIMLGNGNNQNSVMASEASIDRKEGVVEKAQLEAKLVVASAVDSKSLMSEEVIISKRLPVEEPQSLPVPENTGKTDSRSIETVEGSHKVKDASDPASDTSLFDEAVKEIKNLLVGEGPSTELKRILSVGEATHAAFGGDSQATHLCAYNISSTMQGVLDTQLTTSIAPNDECKDSDDLDVESVEISQSLLPVIGNLATVERTDYFKKCNEEVPIENEIRNLKGIKYNQSASISVNEESPESYQAENSSVEVDYNHADEVQNDVPQVVAVTSSDIPYLSGTICTENESECDESTLDQEEMISLHVEEHPHGCVTYENEDKYIQLVKDENHILQKEQVCNDLTTYI